MLTRGQGEPSGIVSGRLETSSVQGQPARPGGGGGSSASVGQRISRVSAPNTLLSDPFHRYPKPYEVPPREGSSVSSPKQDRQREGWKLNPSTDGA